MEIWQKWLIVVIVFFMVVVVFEWADNKMNEKGDC